MGNRKFVRPGNVSEWFESKQSSHGYMAHPRCLLIRVPFIAVNCHESGEIDLFFRLPIPAKRK